MSNIKYTFLAPKSRKQAQILHVEPAKEKESESLKFHLPLVSHSKIEFGLSFYERKLQGIRARYFSGSTPPKYLSREDELWLFEIRDNALPLKNKARDIIVEMNQGLIATILQKFQMDNKCRHLKHDDFMQEGSFGLMEAFEKFEPPRGVRFSTFSGWLISAHIIGARLSMEKTVYIPQKTLKRISHVKKEEVKNENNDNSKQDYDKSEINKVHETHETDKAHETYCTTSVQKKLCTNSLITKYKSGLLLLSEVDAYANTNTHANAYADSSDKRKYGTTYLDNLPDSQLPHSDEIIFSEQQRARILASVSRLSKLEQRTVTRFYGLDHEEPENFQEMAERIGQTRQRMDYLWRSAIRKLKKTLTEVTP